MCACLCVTHMQKKFVICYAHAGDGGCNAEGVGVDECVVVCC